MHIVAGSLSVTHDEEHASSKQIIICDLSL
jgi:hypothetical protein